MFLPRYRSVLGCSVAIACIACGGEDFGADTGPGSGASGTGGTGASGTGGSGAEGGGGGTPAECVPSEASGAVAGTCGVFVDASSGSDENDGAQGAPFKSLSAALAKAEGKTIYVCAAVDAAVAGITVTASQDVFGGLDCADWTYSGEASAITAAANVVPIRIDGADVTARIEDVAVVAANATEQGADSIALFIAGADVTLSRVSLKAGDGAEGAAGEDGGAQVPVDSTMNGAMGANAGTTPANAAGGTNNCAAVLTGGFGGKGGDKTEAIDKDGGNGTTGDAGPGAAPGSGQITDDATWNCNQAPAKGGAYSGNPGDNGGAGPGGAGLGELTEGGLIGRDGEPGTAATAGKSGGGGGGSAATATTHGAGGGGGGAGGCAGKSGGGGKAGGSSIALVAVGGTLSLEAVTLTVGKGGVGGKGGPGQFGQGGGMGGPGGALGAGVAAGCGGGTGGLGGTGGNAGGGAGGHAIGLAQAGARVSGKATVKLDAAMAGDGGDGGDNGLGAGGTGEPGTIKDVQEF